MAELEIPGGVEDLCLARGGDVNPNRPLFTGDVIDAVQVPVLGGDARMVVIVSHPCSMRAGPELAPLVHVAPVEQHHAANDNMWRAHFKVMPMGAVGNAGEAAAKLDRMTLVPSNQLDVSRRLFCASRPGINLLRQRLVHHLTRVVVVSHLFDEEAAGAHEEVDLMEEWLDAAAEHGAGSADAAAAFHDWITDMDGDRKRQDLLLEPQAVPGVRRALRAEIAERFTP